MPTPLSNRRRIRKALTGIGCGAFTAIMLLQLTQSGMVHFSDPVAKYLPKTRSVHNSFPDAAPVTLLQLALHTSGLALDSRDAGIYTKGSASDWEKTLVAALAHTSYEFASGTHGALSIIDDSILALALRAGPCTSHTPSI